MTRKSSSHWSFRLGRFLFALPSMMVSGMAPAHPPIVAVACDVRAKVTEVEIDGAMRSIVALPLRFALKGKRYVACPNGPLVAVPKGKQFRYVPMAA